MVGVAHRVNASGKRARITAGPFMGITVASALVDFHSNFSRVVVIYSAIIGAWGPVVYVRGASSPRGGYPGALALQAHSGKLPPLVGARAHSGHAATRHRP